MDLTAQFLRAGSVVCTEHFAVLLALPELTYAKQILCT